VATTGQAFAILGTLAQGVRWERLDMSNDRIQAVIRDPTRLSAEFTRFLENNARMVIGTLHVVPINRKKPLSLSMLFGWWEARKWHFINQDERALGFTAIDFTKVRLETFAKDDDLSPFLNDQGVKERLEQVSGIHLDIQVMLKLFAEQHLIPSSWKQYKVVWFTGTEFMTTKKGSLRYMLGIGWHGGEWRFFVHSEGDIWDNRVHATPLLEV
jgi:hypothetical protein